MSKKDFIKANLRKSDKKELLVTAQGGRTVKRAAGACLLGILAAGGLLLTDHAQIYAAEESDTIAAGVSIGSIDVGGMTKAEAAEAVEAYVDSLMNAEFTLLGASGSITVTAEDMGIAVDTDTCVEEALNTAASGNLIRRFKEQKALDEGSYTVELALTVDKQQTAMLIYEASEELNIEAEDNTLIRENGSFTYVEGQAGEEVDIVASVYAINDYLADEWNGTDGTIQLVTAEVTPRGSEEEFSHITDVIGSYSTSFASSSAARATNVTNGCEKVNGTILYPGEEFSVYEAVSPFTEENGYELAASYASGTTVESFGGGICQVSTTLYNAVIRAELEVTMRYSHSMIVSYVDPSEDAAIAGTYKDLRFVNNTDYPIYIQGYCSGGIIYFNIYGEETRDADRVVTFESEVTDTTEPETEITLDSSLKYGSYYTEQSAHTGYVARLWKIVTVSGTEESREIFNNSTYQASPMIVVFGTSGATEEQVAELQAAADAGDLSTAKAIANAVTDEPEEESEEEAQEGEEGEEDVDDDESESEGDSDSNSSGNTSEGSDSGDTTDDDSDSSTPADTDASGDSSSDNGE